MQIIKIKRIIQKFIIWLEKICYSIVILTFFLLTFREKNIDNVTAMFEYKDGMEVVYAND